MPNESHGKPHQLLMSGKQGRPSSVCPDISLAVLAAVAVHDSLAIGSALLQEETSAASCEQSGFRS